MKRFFICTLICSLTALWSCQQNDEPVNESTNTVGKKITVSAQIKGNKGDARVALTETQDENQNPTVKVEWRTDANNPETFILYQMDVPATDSDETSNDGGAAGGDAGSGDGGASVAVPITFTQVNGTNQFTGEVDENYTGTYEAVYGEGNLALQNGTLNQEDCVYMVAENITDLTQPITFEHQTAILKVAFKVGNAALNLSDISDVVMRNVTPFLGEKSSTITIIPAAQASGNDVYIFLPASSGYSAGHSFTFGVTTTDNNYYEATLTIPAEMSVVKGKLYTATIKLEEAIPYVTFSALEEQTMLIIDPESLSVDIFCSVNGGAWEDVWIKDNSITFGGAHGDLRLRATSEDKVGTSGGFDQNSYRILFTEPNVPVACTGDIRTLVDGENYATAITSNAKFYGLFEGCTQLTSAPKLPAATLAWNCYKSMFSGCSSLTTAPELPATALAAECYAEMFYGCESLTSAPALPAINLADGCYYMMFRGCTQLATAPELPATALARNCYAMMFYGCTSLTSAPALPATALANGCYSSMFYGCKSLATAPALPATTLADGCYSNMFLSCISLNAAPALPVTTLKPNCYDGMFKGCISLTSAPELPATTLADGCYAEMFRGCTQLTTAPVLPASTLTQSCYREMFRGCTQLTTAPELPATILTQSCYQQMFYDCTQLTTAPVLPATTLVDYCYKNMFNGCTKLNNITMLATDISADECLENWVEGVAENGTFTKAASMDIKEDDSEDDSGDDYMPVFLSSRSANPSIPWGVNGIPEGWKVKSYVDPDVPSGGEW